MRVLYAASEALPYWKTGGLADVARALPDALQARGHEVHLVLPYYRSVREQDLVVEEVGEAVLPWSAGRVPVRFLEHRPADAAPAIFVDIPAAFDVEAPYGVVARDPLTLARRFALFCRAVVAWARRSHAELVHLNDWQTGLVPVYALLDGLDAPSVFAIHNLAYQGNFPPRLLPAIDVPEEFLRTENGLEFFGTASFMKAGLALADRLLTVSPTYAREIQTAAFGAGLDGLLRFRRRVLHGILNGLDGEHWNPATDRALPAPYDVRHLQGKHEDRAAVLHTLHLEDSGPLYVMITRLAHQKGIDLVLDALPALLERGGALAVLGDGDPGYETALADASRAAPRAISFHSRFDDALARRLYAGGDFLLMPSRYEPCGLGQMIAQRYGTVPIVRRTGGLADTVEDGRTGFAFNEESAAGLLDAASRARRTWRARGWDTLRRRCMRLDRSWGVAAERYEEVYALACGTLPG